MDINRILNSIRMRKEAEDTQVAPKQQRQQIKANETAPASPVPAVGDTAAHETPDAPIAPHMQTQQLQDNRDVPASSVSVNGVTLPYAPETQEPNFTWNADPKMKPAPLDLNPQRDVQKTETATYKTLSPQEIQNARTQGSKGFKPTGNSTTYKTYDDFRKERGADASKLRKERAKLKKTIRARMKQESSNYNKDMNKAERDRIKKIDDLLYQNWQSYQPGSYKTDAATKEVKVLSPEDAAKKMQMESVQTAERSREDINEQQEQSYQQYLDNLTLQNMENAITGKGPGIENFTYKKVKLPNGTTVQKPLGREEAAKAADMYAKALQRAKGKEWYGRNVYRNPGGQVRSGTYNGLGGVKTPVFKTVGPRYVALRPVTGQRNVRDWNTYIRLQRMFNTLYGNNNWNPYDDYGAFTSLDSNGEFTRGIDYRTGRPDNTGSHWRYSDYSRLTNPYGY